MKAASDVAGRAEVLELGAWAVGDGQFRLAKMGAAQVRKLPSRLAWWLMNFCEMNLALVEAQAIDYDSSFKPSGGAEALGFYPPRGISVSYEKTTIVATRGRKLCVVENDRRPDVWSLLQELEAS